MSITYTVEQEAAIAATTNLLTRVVGVSGPAGSGKTTLIEETVRRLMDMGREVVLAAPTGRAARRMFEVTGEKAVTIHRLLEYGHPVIDEDTGEPEEVGPARTERNPIMYDDVIVDEFAMVPWKVYDNLISAMRRGARLICFGDVAQLQPVEEHAIRTRKGTAFEYVLSMRSAVKLSQIHRQVEGSGILINAERVRKGLSPRVFPDFRIWHYEMDRKQPIEAVVEFMKSTRLDYSRLQTQFITPGRNGQLGSMALNNTIQGIYHGPGHRGYELPRRKEYDKKKKKAAPTVCRIDVGEKVICSTNVYDLRDFRERYEAWRTDILPVWASYVPPGEEFMMLNGETGIVVGIEPDGMILVEMLDRTVQVPPRILDYNPRARTKLFERDHRESLDLAYAITTHKMQGNEVDHVCLFLHKMLMDNITRNNIYTAITRAKKSVTILTDDGSLNKGVGRTPEMVQAIIENRKKLKGWSIE
jgi:exodeoxyribonuclease V alpha subunit